MIHTRTPEKTGYYKGQDKYFFAIVSAIFLLCAGIILKIFITADAYWILYLSERLLDGQQAYVDFIEVNPPLIIWISAIPALLSKLFSLNSEVTFKLFLLSIILISLRLIWVILIRSNIEAKNTILVSIMLVLVLLPYEQFGQREHIMLTLALPYIFAVYARSKQIYVSKTQLVFSSILAAIGFCIKPYFVFIPCILELFLLYKLRLLTFKRLEPYVMVMAGLTYLASIFIITPEYIHEVIPLLTHIYQAGTGVSFATIAFYSTSLSILTLTIFYILTKFESDAIALYAVIGLTAFANYLSYLLQLKGWPNHLYPTKAMLLIIAIGLAVELLRDRKKLVFSVLLVLQSAYIAYGSIGVRSQEALNVKFFSDILKDYKDQKTMFIMSTWLQDGFPLTNHSQFEWGSKYPSLWFVTGIQKKKNNGQYDETLKTIDDSLKADLAEDFSNYKTDLVLVDVSENNLYRLKLDKHYDFISDFSQNETFAKEWQNYRYIKTIGSYALYERYLNN